MRASGRRLILVTGRILADLEAVFPGARLFDTIVAENGATLWHRGGSERLLAPAPPPAFLDLLRARRVPFDVGRVVVATREPHDGERAREDRLRQPARVRRPEEDAAGVAGGGERREEPAGERRVCLVEGQPVRARGARSRGARTRAAPQTRRDVAIATGEDAPATLRAMAAALRAPMPASPRRADGEALLWRPREAVVAFRPATPPADAAVE